jgi:hypothetical protein
MATPPSIARFSHVLTKKKGLKFHFMEGLRQLRHLAGILALIGVVRD